MQELALALHRPQELRFQKDFVLRGCLLHAVERPGAVRRPLPRSQQSRSDVPHRTRVEGVERREEGAQLRGEDGHAADDDADVDLYDAVRILVSNGGCDVKRIG